jgi:hypothetical protein
MPLQLTVPLEKDYELTRSDETFGVADDDGPTRITVRQGDQGSHERRANLFSQIIREMTKNDTKDVVRLVSRFSFEELKRIEVFLTLKACNIKNSDGDFLFTFNAKGRISEQSFNIAWNMLPPSVAQEIHDCVIDLNVDWRPTEEEGEVF